MTPLQHTKLKEAEEQLNNLLYDLGFKPLTITNYWVDNRYFAQDYLSPNQDYQEVRLTVIRGNQHGK